MVPSMQLGRSHTHALQAVILEEEAGTTTGNGAIVVHGEIQPWVHYVPVNIDLTDLHEKFEWAQSNPAQAEIIAKAGQDFAAATLAENYIKTTHERFFREYLGEVVEAYRPLDSETPDSILRVYEADGLGVLEVAVCNKTYCAMPVEKDKPIAQVRLP
jgi:hypothetical protein